MKTTLLSQQEMLSIFGGYKTKDEGRSLTDREISKVIYQVGYIIGYGLRRAYDSLFNRIVPLFDEES